MNFSDIINLKTLLIICILLCIIVLYIANIHTNRISYHTELFFESNELIDNPYCGFYHIIGYTLTDHYIPSDEYSNQSASYSAPLVLLEINLKNYRKTEISKTGLEQLEDILSAWSGTDTKLILRFLYDWDGLAQVTEPETLNTILTHINQISGPVNNHCGSVYIMQGIFTGNWGEMHHSRFMDETSVKALIRQLNDVIDPSVYLSVRTPAQWRMINGLYDIPEEFPAFGADNSLMGRLGLFNDGILGSESDLGTYGNTERKNASSPAYQGTRKAELEFQNNLCRYVPNGGEAIYNNNLSKLETSVESLRTMHISYLNADYDSRVFDKWRNSVWTGNDAFYGCDGYSYIQAHLGYRYLINDCKIKKSGWINPGLNVTLTLQNDGFSSAMRPLHASFLLKNTDSGECANISLNGDLRKLGGGEKQSFTVKLPLNEMKDGRYKIYFSITDTVSGRMILLGNKNNHTDDGYLLGQLEK